MLIYMNLFVQFAIQIYNIIIQIFKMAEIVLRVLNCRQKPFQLLKLAKNEAKSNTKTQSK